MEHWLRAKSKTKKALWILGFSFMALVFIGNVFFYEQVRINQVIQGAAIWAAIFFISALVKLHLLNAKIDLYSRFSKELNELRYDIKRLKSAHLNSPETQFSDGSNKTEKNGE